jgi:hypothetical protein
VRTRNDGAAREVAPGRLANFEDDDEPDQLRPSLPPRHRRTTPAVASPAAAVPPAAVPASVTAAPAITPQRTAAPRPAAGSEEPDAAPVTKGPEQRIRASNVHIPVTLLAPLAAKKDAEGLSNGEIIICAIEATHASLEDLIHPAPTAGGSVFAERRSRPSRAGDGPLTQLNYRLREADFDTLDRLVERFQASSRAHLITVALTAYFNQAS